MTLTAHIKDALSEIDADGLRAEAGFDPAADLPEWAPLEAVRARGTCGRLPACR